MKSTITILQEIVANIISPVIVVSIGVVTAEVFTVVSTDTQWLYVSQVVTIEGNDYTVEALEQNVSFDLKQRSHTNVITGSFNIPPPTFFYGTWIMTNSERDDIGINSDKVPFIWLYETRTEALKLSPLVPQDRDVPLRLFFMGNSNYQEWLTAKHYDLVLHPLDALVRNFLDAILRSACIVKPLTGDLDKIYHANAGSVDKDGHLKALFNEELSGIEANLTLQINKCCT